MALSKGHFLPYTHRLISPRRSVFPTIGIRFLSKTFGGGYSLLIRFHGSYRIPSLSEGNYPYKPPWIQYYVGTCFWRNGFDHCYGGFSGEDVHQNDHFLSTIKPLLWALRGGVFKCQKRYK